MHANVAWQFVLLVHCGGGADSIVLMRVSVLLNARVGSNSHIAKNMFASADVVHC